MSIALVMLSSHIHPLTPFSPPAFNLSQHQRLFQWVNCSNQMTKTLEFQLQLQSYQQVFRVDFPQDWPVWFPCCPRDSQESSLAPQSKSINSSMLSLLFFWQIMNFILFYLYCWRLITLQYCSGFCHTLTWISHGFTCIPHPGTPPPPPSPSHPSGSSQCTSPEHLSHASNLDWRSVSHLIIHMFRCCSLRSSHPRLLP